MSIVPIRSAAALAMLGFATACSSLPDLAPPAGTPEAASTSRQSASLDASALTVGDQAFLTQAAYGGLAEVAMGEMAAKQGASAAVRRFGQTMASEHRTANQELVALAKAKGMSPPTAPDPGRQAAASALSSLQGANFDRQYLQQQTMEHDVAIALYQSQARAGSDSQVRAFAQKWLPVLQNHAAMLRNLAPSVAANGT